MGVDSKKPPPLPAPTETDTNSPSELATDISRPGDEQSTYSLPEDGTPVTIRTRGHKANRSQTSLLIEYFEGGKVSASGSGSTERKPSVRVRLTPSKKSKGDHFQVTETKGSRKVSLSRRVPVDQSAHHDLDVPEGEDAHSMTSYASATEESNVSRNPLDIEIERGHRRRRPASPLIPSEERASYQPGNPSEISAIPTDSFLDGTGPSGDVRSTTHSKADALAGAAVGAAAGALASEALHSSKTRSKERVKLSEKARKETDKSRRSSKSRTSSRGEHPPDEIRSPRRRSSRGQQESYVSGGDSSMISSTSQRSLDVRSVRSGASKTSSINNPKLLETVEDAIRRLILPELSALKREQSKREGRRSSITSTGTGASREDIYTDRRRDSGHKTEGSRDSLRSRERRNREARHDYDDRSMHSVSRDSVEGEYTTASPRRSGGGDLLKAAAAGAAGYAAARGIGAAMDGSASPEPRHRERRRLRGEEPRSRSLGRDMYDQEYDEDEAPAPPMPLMSDINPSEVTRTSILSADTDRPHSAEEEILTTRQLQNSGAVPQPVVSHDKAAVELLPPLSTQHANVSHGDLRALPRGQENIAPEYETDEFGRKVPISQDDYYQDERPRGGPDYSDYSEEQYYNNFHAFQDVPPPLKYVPYQAGARGLSPIPSVSGYTEASEAPLPHHTRSINSVGDIMSSPGKSPQHVRTRSMHSVDSIQLTPDMHRQEEEYFEDTAAGQEVRRGSNANPNIVHPGSGVESAVASLVDGSVVDQSVVTGMSGQDNAARSSFVSAEDAARLDSRGVSPDKMSVDSRQEFLEDTRITPEPRGLTYTASYYEYELDDDGRKISGGRQRQQRRSPTASEAAITMGAVGAAAAAIKAAQLRKTAIAEGRAEEQDFQPAGVARNRSFKERAKEWQPKVTPAASVDSLGSEPPKMGASALPDFNDPDPAYGYGHESDLITNPSIVGERLDGGQKDINWADESGRATPTARSVAEAQQQGKTGLGISPGAAALGAAALGAAAGLAASGAHGDHEDREWRRTSEERKRDTLITNPYEDASPIQNPTLDDSFLEGRLEGQYGAPYTASPVVDKYAGAYAADRAVGTPTLENRGKNVEFGDLPADDDQEDPFYVSKENPRHLSGLSQGVSSPFYDASTGAGMDRIDNKDIVALMQHLMVRDAQRSARDTEIVALLMNAALENKNSFKEMKELVQDTSDDVIFANVENTEKLQKSMDSPRHLGVGARSITSPSQADEAGKKKNLWKRAMQGLSGKGSNDLARIEDMLVHLLGEVNDLKAQNQQAPPLIRGTSADNVLTHDVDDGDAEYGAEDGAYTTHSGPATARGTAARNFSDHRISTVPENEEEFEYDRQQQPAQPAPPALPAKELLSPGYDDERQRGGSAPLEASPHTGSGSQQAALSAENTPKSEKGKKHKSSSSSGWFPKISRWSETTASSVGKAFRGSGTFKKSGGKYEDYQPPSRSGSSLASYGDNYAHDPYEDQLPAAMFAHPHMVHEDLPKDIPHPPLPSFAPSDDPKYKAHRNSVNLQHPQPRSGQAERYRTTLEESAQEYDSPKTPRSTDWAGSATSLSRLPPNSNRYSNSSSQAARDTEYAMGSPQGPPRPPKEPLENSPSTPQRSNRVSQLQKDGSLGHTSYESGYVSGTGTHGSSYDRSPKFENRNLSSARGGPSRRPSGPRAMTPKSPEEDAVRDERRRKRGMSSERPRSMETLT